MARIFLSHSSKDNAEAIALRDWLVAEGWDDYFLDLDPERGIVAGERWERALSEAANRCEAVLFLVSRAWLASRWCLREFHLAAKLNKRMFGLLIEEVAIADLPGEVTATWQLVDLAAGAGHQMFRAAMPDGTEQHVTYSKAGLARLKTGLTKAGLDARFFAWPPDDDPERPPYRGLKPLEAEDAGIFFGREAPTIEALDRLRGLSEAAPPRFLVVLGASGAGKSSFLRAGLLPRLSRDDRNYLPLPIVRPERAAIGGESGLLRSLEAAAKARGLKRTRSDIKAAIEDGAPAVAALLADLAEAARAPALGQEARPAPPRILLAIDQGEELFLAEGADEAEAFLALLRDLVADPASNLIVVAAIRSDAYEQLQTAPALEGVRQETLSLPPLPRGAYQTVIEGPAARLRDTRRALKIEPALTGALLANIEAGGAKDALPLLAFTLERLYVEHGGDGDLRLDEYRQLGGIKGSIEAAVDGALRAADADPAVPKDRAARLVLLRRALIPWLAGIDPETGSPRRRVARLSEIPVEARPLVEQLIAARLLATDVSPDTQERTVEPAHEALLRQWSLLEGWLEEDFAALTTLEAVKRAARDWDANSRDEAWLAHNAGRLDDAEALLAREDLAGSLEPTDRAYLAAARAADTARRNRELEEARKLAAAQKEAADRQMQVARRTRVGLIAASLLAVLAIGAGAYALDQAQEAERQAAFATEQAAVADRERQRAEEQAQIAEAQRFEAELLALEAEAARELAEARRVSAEAARAIADGEKRRADAARAEAEAERQRAEEQRLAAEEARAAAVAESVAAEAAQALALRESERAELNFAAAKEAVNGLILDVAEGLRDVAGIRVETIRRILDTVRATVDRLVETAPDDADLRQSQVWMHALFADTYLKAGALSEAIDSAAAGLAIARTQAGADPGDAGARRDLSLSLDRIGDVMLQAGDRAGALAAFEESLEIRRARAEADDGNAAAQDDLAVSLEKIGDVKRLAGDRAGALAAYEESLVVRRTLAEAYPGMPLVHRRLLGSLDGIGDAMLQAGDRAGAHAVYEEILGITRMLAEADPDDAGAQHDLSLSISRIGDLNLQMDDRAGALAAYEESLAIARTLVDADPDNAQAQRGLSLSLDRIGDVMLQANDRAGALAAYEESLVIFRNLVEADPGNAAAQTGLVVSLTQVAKVSVNPAPLYREALELLQALHFEGRLTAAQQGWIGFVEGRLAALSAEDETVAE